MYRSLLVPLDGSPFGEQALPLALSIARRAEATLHLVHVHPPLTALVAEGHIFLDPALDRQVKEQQRDYLDTLAKRLESLAPVRVRSTLLVGDVTSGIRGAAVGEGADLVVMTTHGRGPVSRLWLGSVATALVRELPMPLLLVRPGEQAPDLTSDPEVKRLLLPLDGSPLAEQMLGPASALAALMGAEITLLRVIKPVMPLYAPLEGMTLVEEAQALIERIDRIQEDLANEARSYLEGAAEKIRSGGLAARSRVLLEAQPAVAILHETDKEKIDLIALETHGRRGLARIFLGSVADKVVRGSPVPVLVHWPVF